MNKYLTILYLVLLPLLASSETKPESDDKTQLTDEQLAGFKAAEERYKDNPAKMKIINQFKEKLGITDQPPVPPPPPPKHITSTEGSMSSANAAYAKGDYATALEQYKAMAAQGNPEANIYVGMMYEAGMGTEADDATAQAWYKRAADTPTTDYNHSKLVNEQTVDSYSSNRISAEDAAKAEIINQEINSEIARARGEDPTGYQAIEYSEVETRNIAADDNSSHAYQINEVVEHPTSRQTTAGNMGKQLPRKILFKPEKSELQYTKPESHTEHKHPEKLMREPELNTIEKS